LIGSVTYLIGGDAGTDLSADGYDISIRRGRTRELDVIDPGTATIALRNYGRDYDPLDTTGPYYGTMKPGRGAEISIYGQTIIAGTAEAWQVEYTVNGRADGTFAIYDGLASLGRKRFRDWTTTASQTSGARITAILDRPEVDWPAGQRDIDTGASVLQSDAVTWGSNPLNYGQLVAETELGQLFASRQNVVTFRDRHSLIDATAVATFADDGSGYPFQAATLLTGSERFYNEVGIDREGGTLQRVQDTAAGDEDDIRSLSITGLLMDTDVQSLSMAQWLLSVYKDATPKVHTVTVNVSALDDADQAAVAGLDLGQVVHITWTPLSLGSTIDEDMAIEGIEHSIPFGGPHLMTFTLSPMTQTSVFIIGDATFGVIDGPGRIAF
jgi:hypothetical protein